MIHNKYLVLIDTSYLAFYRFFATIKWYSLSNPESYKDLSKIDNYNWINNTIFIDKYKKMFIESIIKIIKKKFNESNIIFCMDSLKNNLWRNKIFSNYKRNRPDLSKKYNFKPIFDYTFTYLISDIIKLYNNIYTLYYDKLEADDIIAIITNYLYYKKSNQIIYIISGDSDFLQLGNENIYFYNFKSKNIINITKEEANKNLLNKILFGDKTDCIKGIIPKNIKFNKFDLLNNPIKLNDFLNKYPDIKKKFIFNSKIIDFNYIPLKYNKIIINLYNNL